MTKEAQYDQKEMQNVYEETSNNNTEMQNNHKKAETHY